MVWQSGHLLNNGKYEILEVLGRGGFGLTYKARHRQLAMEVVIKTPDILQKRDTEYEDYVKQFEAEGRKLAKFSQTPHPHIVRVWDIFMEGQVPCLVMDFIQGQTLMEKVKAQGKLSEAECLKYIRQIGSALEEVHQAGMVHRDAHPGNIMIQPNGNAILIDFGIAKEIIPASSSSTDYAANPSFAPYEQIYKGSKANRQPSVDIYALAASFYYAVTGEKPTPSMERRLEDRPLKSPKEINRNLSDHLNTAITLGMSLEKGDRPQFMSDWLQKLELPPPPVEPQYRQEKVNPPRSVTPEKEAKAVKSTQKINLKSAQNPIQKKPKNIPWVGLIGVFFLYGLAGFFLGVSLAPWRFWAFPVFMAVNGVSFVTVGWDWDAAMFGAWSAAFGVATSVATSVAVAVDGATARGGDWDWAVFRTGRWSLVVGAVGSLPVMLAWAWVADKLLKYFSRFHSFLILAGTNLSGLGSGWLLGFLLHPKG
jgi:serine/threonine-protein kinase